MYLRLCQLHDDTVPCGLRCMVHRAWCIEHSAAGVELNRCRHTRPVLSALPWGAVVRRPRGDQKPRRKGGLVLVGPPAGHRRVAWPRGIGRGGVELRIPGKPAGTPNPPPVATWLAGL